MALQEKYAELISAATNKEVSNLQVREQSCVLYIGGRVPTSQLKDYLWEIYNKIDPDYGAGDLILNIVTNEAADASAAPGSV